MNSNDGAYYGHSSYAIYSIGGRLFKRVENNSSRTDDLIPSQVALPIGSYTVVAWSQRGGEVRVRFVIKAGQRTFKLFVTFPFYQDSYELRSEE
jgi:hypothetical protein